MSATYEVISPHVSYTSPIRAVTVNADSPTLQVFDTSTGTVSDIYWSSNSAGTDRVYSVNYGDDVYLIVKTLGYGSSASVTFATDKVTAGDLEYGTISGTINVPLTFNADTNSGFGYYRLRTWSEEDMALKDLVPTDFTGYRNVNQTYVNNNPYGIFIMIDYPIPYDDTYFNMYLQLDDKPIDSANKVITDQPFRPIPGTSPALLNNGNWVPETAHGKMYFIRAGGSYRLNFWGRWYNYGQNNDLFTKDMVRPFAGVGVYKDTNINKNALCTTGRWMEWVMPQ